MSVKIWNGEEYAEYDRPASTIKRGTVKVEGGIDSQTHIPVVPTVEKVETDIRNISNTNKADVEALKKETVTSVSSGSKKGEITVIKNGVSTNPVIGHADSLLEPEDLSCVKLGQLQASTKTINILPGTQMLDVLPVVNGGTNSTGKGAALINLGVFSGKTDPASNSVSEIQNAPDGCIYFQLG